MTGPSPALESVPSLVLVHAASHTPCCPAESAAGHFREQHGVSRLGDLAHVIVHLECPFSPNPNAGAY